MMNHDRLKPCHDRVLPKWITDWLKDPVLPEDGEDLDTVYCLCRKPHQGRFMIQCDGCDEWYHGSCVNLTASEAIPLDDWFCPTCR